MPYYRSTWKNLAGVIAASQDTQLDLPTWYHGKRYYLPENGVDPQRFPLAARWREPTADSRFRFITVGRLVPFKGIDLIIEAMAGSELMKRCRLTIVGDGPERESLVKLANQSAMGDSVEFLGWLDQKAIAFELNRAQAFVFPSLKEFGGGVVLEAMSAALPSIVVNYGGPGELIRDETGIRIPMQPRDKLIVALRREMERLVSDHALCRALGEAAVRDVQDRWTWEAKARGIAAMYRDLHGVKH
jgi:glycosyltransferase involved in cell wall biosynthesis